MHGLMVREELTQFAAGLAEALTLCALGETGAASSSNSVRGSAKLLKMRWVNGLLAFSAAMR